MNILPVDNKTVYDTGDVMSIVYRCSTVLSVLYARYSMAELRYVDGVKVTYLPRESEEAVKTVHDKGSNFLLIGLKRPSDMTNSIMDAIADAEIQPTELDERIVDELAYKLLHSLSSAAGMANKVVHAALDHGSNDTVLLAIMSKSDTAAKYAKAAMSQYYLGKSKIGILDKEGTCNKAIDVDDIARRSKQVLIQQYMSRSNAIKPDTSNNRKKK